MLRREVESSHTRPGLVCKQTLLGKRLCAKIKMFCDGENHETGRGWRRASRPKVRSGLFSAPFCGAAGRERSVTAPGSGSALLRCGAGVKRERPSGGSCGPGT